VPGHIGDELVVIAANRDLTVLLGLLEGGRLSAPIGLVLPWEDLADGLQVLADRQIPGKLVLTIS
jgi:hypothetical protein